LTTPKQAARRRFFHTNRTLPARLQRSNRAGAAFRVEWPAMKEGDVGAQLMLRYAAGDARAFDELYAAHRGALWRFIRRSVREPAATDDVFQECW
jgi:hypothetical protein